MSAQYTIFEEMPILDWMVKRLSIKALPRGNASIGVREGMKVTIVPIETVVMDSENESFCCMREGMKVTIVPIETVVMDSESESFSCIK